MQNLSSNGKNSIKHQRGLLNFVFKMVLYIGNIGVSFVRIALILRLDLVTTLITIHYGRGGGGEGFSMIVRLVRSSHYNMYLQDSSKATKRSGFTHAQFLI